MFDLKRRKRYNIFISEWGRLALVLMIAAAMVAITAVSVLRERWPTLVSTTQHTLVIDPGHGGFDGGAISDDGSKESDINLAIGLKMRTLAELVGLNTVMTRSDDSARTDYASYSEHEDLVLRTAIANNTPGAILVSVHQNDFPTGQPSGAQVLYAASPGSEDLGKTMHGNLIRLLDPQNRRVAAPAPKSLYITSHVNCPAVLAECGFMSNNFEVEKLNSESYRGMLALVMVGSVLQYLSQTQTI